MLPPHIIEEIRKREELRREQERPALPLPMEDLPPLAPEPKQDDDDGRGVIIIELFPTRKD